MTSKRAVYHVLSVFYVLWFHWSFIICVRAGHYQLFLMLLYFDMFHMIYGIFSDYVTIVSVLLGHIFPTILR